MQIGGGLPVGELRSQMRDCVRAVRHLQPEAGNRRVSLLDLLTQAFEGFLTFELIAFAFLPDELEHLGHMSAKSREIVDLRRPAKACFQSLQAPPGLFAPRVQMTECLVQY